MSRRIVALLGVVLTGSLLSSVPVSAKPTMGNYTAQPPFITDGVATPNILFVLDASSSMRRLAAQEIDGDDGPGYWDEDNTYAGYFDSMKCYTYDSANKRFEASGSTKAAINTTCASTLWDGNFLNWATTRRFDAAKIAMTGGTCIDTATDQVGNRDADGICLPSGSPAKKTITALHQWYENEGSIGGHRTTEQVKGPGNPNPYVGRVPDNVQQPAVLGGNDLYFHIRGGVAGMQGSFCVSPNSSPPDDDATSCDTGEIYVEQQFYIRVVVDTEPQGVIQQVGGRARFGLMMLSKNGPQDGRGWMTVPVGLRQTRDHLGTTLETFNTNEAAMIDAVDESYHLSGTPAVEALYEAIRYYAQIGKAGGTAFHTMAFPGAAALGAAGTGSLGPGEISVLTGTETCPSEYLDGACGRDPLFFGSDHTPPWAQPSAQIPCCQNYIILFTDGAPNSQTALPSALRDYGHSVHGAHCCGIDNDDYDLVGLAYWGHIHDLRQGTVPVIGENGHDAPGVQNVTVYSFFAFGDTDGRDLLQLTAKFGGFEDSDQPGDPGYNLPDKASEYDKVNNYTGAAVPDDIPDTYYESSNANDLQDKLTATITSILQRSGSGSAASVLTSSSTGEGAVYQAFFFPTTVDELREVKWTGYTQGLFLDTFGNLREDTNGDDKLVYEEDQIIRSRLDSSTNQVMLDRFDDADGNGIADTTSPVGSVALRGARSIWEAGNRLALTASGARDIITWVDKNGDGVVDSAEQMKFTTGNLTALAPFLDATDSNGDPLPAPFTADNIINFIRGDQITGLRDRQLRVGGTQEVWKLGDTIHAQPLVVGPPTQRYDITYGDSSYSTFFNQYKDRRRVAYVGANDGMLHAFNAGYYHPGDDPDTTSKTEHGWFTETPDGTGSGKALGQELWGFIPQELLPHLKWLTQPDYNHVYYVDLTPKVTDVRIFTPDADHPNGWGTILMGGMRFGGSCKQCSSSTGAPEMKITADFDGDGSTEDRVFHSAYFVLDITNPEVSPKLLWSFSSSDLGLTTSVPSMLRVSPANDSVTDDTNAMWYMIVGSGPTGYDAAVAQSSTLYAIDLEQGPGTNNSQVTTLPVGIYTSFMGDTLTIDRDFDYRVDVTYAGRVIHDGTLPWRGKLYRLTMNDCVATPCVPNIWGVEDNGNRIPTEILNTFQDGGGTSLELGPIAAAPAVAIDDANKLWVFAGTGRYYDAIDKTNTDTQYFVGVKDSVLNGTCTESTRTSCHDNDLVDVSTAEVCVIGVDDCGSGTDQVTGVTGATDFPSLINLVASKDGWFTTLLPPTGPPQGERVLVRPLVFGGLVLFPTFTPTNDICASTGDSYLYALYYRTGSAYSAPVIGTTPKSGKEYVKRSKWIGEGMASAAVVHMGHGSSRGKATAYVQTSTGELTGITIDTQGEITSRLVSWLDLRN